MKDNIAIWNHADTSRDETGLFYRDPLNKWFYVPAGFTPVKPEFLSFTRGFRLKNKLVHAILSAGDEYSIQTTDADAVITNFFLTNGKRETGRKLPGTPVIFQIHFWSVFLFGLSNLINRIERSGAAGLYVTKWLPGSVLKKLCQETSLPVISAGKSDMDQVLFMIKAGVYAVCLPGKHVSKEMITVLHESHPNVPLIASCGKSKNTMMHCLKSGIDAIIYRPCIPFGSENRYDDRRGYF